MTTTTTTYYQLHHLVQLPLMNQWFQSPTGKARLDSLGQGAIRLVQSGHGFRLSSSNRNTLYQLVKCLKEAEAKQLVYVIPIGAPGWKPTPHIIDGLVKGHFYWLPKSTHQLDDDEYHRERIEAWEREDRLAEYNRQLDREIYCDKHSD